LSLSKTAESGSRFGLKNASFALQYFITEIFLDVNIFSTNEFTPAGLFDVDDHAADITSINFTGINLFQPNGV